MTHDGAEEVQALVAALGQSAHRGLEPLAAHVETDAARGGRSAAAIVHRAAGAEFSRTQTRASTAPQEPRSSHVRNAAWLPSTASRKNGRRRGVTN